MDVWFCLFLGEICSYPTPSLFRRVEITHYRGTKSAVYGKGSGTFHLASLEIHSRPTHATPRVDDLRRRGMNGSQHRPLAPPSPNRPGRSLLLVHVHDVRVAVRQQASLAPLAADSALLVPAEDGLRRRLLVRVDEDGTGLEAAADAFRMRDVAAPDAGGEAGAGVVGARDNFFLVLPGLRGDDRACGKGEGKELLAVGVAD